MMHTYIIKASNFQEDYSLLFFISNNYLFSLFAIITALANTTAKIPKILSIARIPVPVFGVSSFSPPCSSLFSSLFDGGVTSLTFSANVYVLKWFVLNTAYPSF